MPPIKLEEYLRPLTDLKARARSVVEQAQRTGRPVVLTRYGKGVAVLLSVQAFDEIQATVGRLRRLLVMQAARTGECLSEVEEHEEWDVPPGGDSEP